MVVLKKLTLKGLPKVEGYNNLLNVHCPTYYTAACHKKISWQKHFNLKVFSVYVGVRKEAAEW